MISIARKNLLYEKAKFLVSISGVALSTLLVLALVGVYFGISNQAKALPLNSGADHWIVQNGTTDLFHTISILPSGQEKALQTIPGVRQASPLINHATKVKASGRQFTAAVIGFDTKSGLGLPSTLYRGARTVGKHEAIIDYSMSRKYGINIGDQMTIGSINFKVVGLSRKTNAVAFQYVFISYPDAVEAFKQVDIVSYYLANFSQDNPKLQSSIAKLLPTSETKTKESLAEGNANVISESFLPIISMLVLIGLAVGTAVVGLTIYTATSERAKEYGVLKAVGVKDRQLFEIVFKQTLIAEVLGFAVGVGLYFLVQYIAFYAVPAVSFTIPNQYFAVVFVASLLTGVLAALIPLRKISRIDPAEAFAA